MEKLFRFLGVGAGFYLKIPKGQIFQLSVLYSASSKVRKTRRKRLENNNLLELVSNDDGEQVVELKPAVRACCCAMDAFIYVVDSTIGRDFGELLLLLPLHVNADNFKC